MKVKRKDSLRLCILNFIRAIYLASEVSKYMEFSTGRM
jgi:hypothetical protein